MTAHGYGGGIYVQGGSLTVSESTLSGNSSAAFSLHQALGDRLQGVPTGQEDFADGLGGHVEDLVNLQVNLAGRRRNGRRLRGRRPTWRRC
jgi:hypothetical protein